ncbi:MAG TPA: hypothetical protein VH724_15380 [Candidatus Angelobacter sp.]|nr:hypothetical protein [Candidatus Angelobacter sp.]
MAHGSDMKAPFTIEHHPGWTGAFTRHQAREANYPNGCRIQKIKEDQGDATPLGTQGTVLGSVHVNGPGLGTAYFVEWDNKPNCARFVVEWKLARA